LELSLLGGPGYTRNWALLRISGALKARIFPVPFKSRDTMPLLLNAEQPPMTAGPDGVVRIAGTRVTLDTVVAAFADGATAEEIVQQYPTLQLSDVYAVIGYYLRRKADVDEYLAERESQAHDVRRANEAAFDPAGIRVRLLSRRQT
jgi:uncharacterized protein (DUF433 family)